ncbi:hypothetical protein HS088_TW17G00319 [Tripterygium wilfordii]|uniref:N-acetyltransferase domain-containing protein n=1 Tax=Tripterygium wilfordii TaxID=458696 RepID=A0A7J7CFW9_TRIWF|nr:uncharacterized protein LOC119982284 [Tripterygium wilfordii]KAF5732787.1 hypothetical protein HS088_TW17G00319 [Tripterygium wilfordii]
MKSMATNFHYHILGRSHVYRETNYRYTRHSCRVFIQQNKGLELERCRVGFVQCCGSPTSSLKKEVGLIDREYLVSEYGWNVRRLAEEKQEIREAANIQAEAFHTPVALFNDMFFEFFKAEVISGLLYKLRNSPPNRYACLVAEAKQKLVGIVDVTVMRDEAVLQHLRGAEEYLYVSGIAVLQTFRRQKVASALLKACDMLSLQLGFDYLVLWAYEDDLGARKLYSSAGYKVISGDPPWISTWIGRKRRILMIKRSHSS